MPPGPDADADEARAQLRLVGPRVILRSPVEADRPALARILAEPGVARWWHLGGAEQEVIELFEDADHVPLIVELAGDVAGYLQFSEELDPDYRHASIDLFLATAAQGRGIGPEAIRVAARYLFDVRGHHRITIDPVADNGRAIAAYEKVGFRPVGRLRQYQRMGDGTWARALLMDLLGNELVRE